MAAKLNVFMVGGRRCGKTTVLSRIYDHFNEVLRHDAPGEMDLLVSSLNGADIPHITKANSAIDAIFTEHAYDEDFIVEDYNPTQDISEISFILTPTRGRQNLSVCFRDIPGEWCNGKSADGKDTVTAKGINGIECTKSPLDFVVDYLKASNVAIIAIDTPAMMEEEGAFNNTVNRIGPITEAFKSIVDTGGNENLSDKLILFVPLKCEKYVVNPDGSIDNDGMMTVAEKVQESYSDLIDFLKNTPPLNDSISAAILPIVTIKEVLWSKFGCLWEGQRSSIYNDLGRPRSFPPQYDSEKVLFSYFSFRNEKRYLEIIDTKSKTKAGSEFCEQPLVYALVYSMNLYLYRQQHPAKQGGGFFEQMGRYLREIYESIADLFSENTDFKSEAQRLSSTKMKRGNGFEIIQDARRLLG